MSRIMFSGNTNNNDTQILARSCVWLSRPTVMVHSLVGTDDEGPVTLLSRHRSICNHKFQ